MDDDSSAGRSNKGNETTETSGIQKPEQRHAVLASELAQAQAQAGQCVSSVSPQQAHTDLDSDVSDDTDQELDIEDDHEFTRNPQF